MKNIASSDILTRENIMTITEMQLQLTEYCIDNQCQFRTAKEFTEVLKALGKIADVIIFDDDPDSGCDWKES